MRLWMTGVSVLAMSGVVVAQSKPAAKPVVVTTPEVFNFEKLAAQGKELVEKAKAGAGSAGITLSTYAGHFMSLNGRTKSGGGEFHRNWNDFLIVVSGECTEMTGGTMVEGKEGADGEIRGTRLEGATAHVLHKGDFIHIPAGTNHQQVMLPGQTVVVLAIKVAAETKETSEARPTAPVVAAAK